MNGESEMSTGAGGDVDATLATSPHSASASALGYLYQTQWPLVELVARSRQEPDCEVALELIDDVSWEKDGSPTELIQTKHHTRTSGGLGDMSPDIWRTLASWMSHRPGEASGPILTLVTTDVATVGTAAHLLRPPEPDWQGALSRLELAAEASDSRETEAARKRFLALPPAEREILVMRIRVLDGATRVDDLTARLQNELHFAVPVGYEDVFVELVWAWWHGCVLDLLQRKKRSVGGLELRAFVDDLRDRFTSDNLPTLVNAWDVDPSVGEVYKNHVFVRQLGWIDVPSTILQQALQNYFRAVTQSARWVDEHLVGFDEIERFETDLKNEWARIFAWIEQQLPPKADDAQKVEAGREVLRKAEDIASVRIRERYSEPFFFRGKLHQLADEREIGWHPEFRQRLEQLLLGTSP